MNVTPDVVAKVTAQVSDKTRSFASIVAELNEPQFENPVHQQSILTPFDFESISALIGPDSMKKMVNYIHFNLIISDTRARDRDAVILWAKALAAGEYLISEEAADIINMLSATIPDPNWRETLSWSEINLGGFLVEDDVRQVAMYGKWNK